LVVALGLRLTTVYATLAGLASQSTQLSSTRPNAACSSVDRRPSSEHFPVSTRIQANQVEAGTEFFTALHGDIYRVYRVVLVLLTCRRKVVSGRRPPISLTFVLHVLSLPETDHLLLSAFRSGTAFMTMSHLTRHCSAEN